MRQEKEVRRAQERSKTIRALMAEGVSREDANMIVDLTAHVISECQKKFMTICDSAPEHLRSHIAANAAVGLADTFTTALNVMEIMGVKMRPIG